MSDTFSIARCPTHGLHGARDTCYVCSGPVDQVEMVSAIEHAHTVGQLGGWIVALSTLVDRHPKVVGRAIEAAVRARLASVEIPAHIEHQRDLDAVDAVAWREFCSLGWLARIWLALRGAETTAERIDRRIRKTDGGDRG